MLGILSSFEVRGHFCFGYFKIFQNKTKPNMNPKPSATQRLLNCAFIMQSHPKKAIASVAKPLLTKSFFHHQGGSFAFFHHVFLFL